MDDNEQVQVSYKFDKKIVAMLRSLAETERRTMTAQVEVLIISEYNRRHAPAPILNNDWRPEVQPAE